MSSTSSETWPIKALMLMLVKSKLTTFRYMYKLKYSSFHYFSFAVVRGHDCFEHLPLTWVSSFKTWKVCQLAMWPFWAYTSSWCMKYILLSVKDWICFEQTSLVMSTWTGACQQAIKSQLIFLNSKVCRMSLSKYAALTIHMIFS